MLKINGTSKPAKRLTPELVALIEQIQEHSIKLSCETGELISLLKRQNPQYKKLIQQMENA